LLSKIDTTLSKFDIYDNGIVVLVKSSHRALFAGLIRIHVLVHASHEPIFGLGMMAELKHHGYMIGPGTLYPLLHGMERSGLLRSSTRVIQGRSKRLYTITPDGRRALMSAKEKVSELHKELLEEHPRPLPD
jgi:PadR family transcriptional regulator PadR